MNYPLHARKSKWNKQKIALAIILLCVFFGFFARSFFAKNISGVSNAIFSFIYSIMPQGFKSKAELALENQALTDQILALSAINADRNELARENAELKNNFMRSDKRKVVYAVVIKKPPSSPYDTFILDTGTESNVLKGYTVILGNVAIGAIVEVGRSYSKAELFSSPGKIFEGVFGKDHLTIEVKGLGGWALESFLPIGTEVSLGDDLILPSISSKIYATVEKIEEKQSEGFKRGLFTLPFNPSQINAVGIILEN